MDFNVLNRGEAQKAMEEWIESYPALPLIDKKYDTVRNDIQEMNRKLRSDVAGGDDSKYYIDSHLGLELYKYFWNIPGFSLRVAADDGFWRYLSVKVVPDVVAQRWGKDNADHFWSKPTRIWLRSIWWFVHLSWQGDYDSTKKLLETEFFTTDTILNFEERNGRKGACIEAYRQIIKYYGQVPEDTVKRFSRNRAGKSDDLFRVVMKLNTAKMTVVEPALCIDGEAGYARELFADAGVDFDVT
ncbi:MAG: hypothetical protein IJ121_04845 [Eubacterium sp.]|nr:hypothetical protein [Eubacterium sp.]